MSTTTVRGRVYLRQADGSIGEGVPGTELVFVPESHAPTYRVATDAEGRYAVHLPPARYYVRATHPGYEDYASAPGYVKVSAPEQICNVFLRAPQVTTVIVVRHAERAHGHDELAAPAGHARARALRDLLLRSGVTELYATETARARATCAPLAEDLGLTIQPYQRADEVAQRILRLHQGDLCLVVAHADSALAIAEHLGAPAHAGALAGHGDLLVVSRHGASAHLLHLAYGAESGPHLTLSAKARATTVLLVGTGEGAGDAPARLRQLAAPAGVTTIYASGRLDLVAPLAAAIGVAPLRYDASALLGLVEDLLAHREGQTVVVSGSHDERREFLRLLGAHGTPLASTDADELLVVTRFATGEVRVLPLRLHSDAPRAP